MKMKKYFSDGLLLALISGAGYFATYFYERSILLRFGIPGYFTEITAGSLANAVFFILCLLVLSWVIWSLLYLLNSLVNDRLFITPAMVLLLVVSSVVLASISYWQGHLLNLVIYSLVVFFFIPLLMLAFAPEGEDNKEPIKMPFKNKCILFCSRLNNLFENKTFSSFLSVFASFILLPFFVSCLGLDLLEKQIVDRDFYQHEGGRFIVRKYGDLLLLKEYDEGGENFKDGFCTFYLSSTKEKCFTPVEELEGKSKKPASSPSGPKK